MLPNQISFANKLQKLTNIQTNKTAFNFKTKRLNSIATEKLNQIYNMKKYG